MGDEADRELEAPLVAAAEMLGRLLEMIAEPDPGQRLRRLLEDGMAGAQRLEGVRPEAGRRAWPVPR